MSMGSRGGDVRQQVIIELMSSGDFGAAIDQLKQLQAAQDGAASSSYEVGHSYEVLATAATGYAQAELNAALKAEAARQQSNRAADTWAGRQSADLNSVITDMHHYEQVADKMTATELRNYTVVIEASGRKVAAVNREGDASVRAAQGAARGFLELSRGVEDFTTGGFLDVLNNIPGIVQGMGTAAGLAAPQVAARTGGISLLATGVYILYKNWDKIEDFFEAGIPRPILDTTDELKKKLAEATKITDDLGKETRLSFDELLKYEKATADVKKFNLELERRRDLEALLAGQSKAERERASGFKEAVAESGGIVAVDALDTAIGQGADAKGMVFNEYENKATKTKDLADRLMVEAAKGDTRARDEITRFLKAAYGDKSQFAANIGKYSPEGKEAEAERDAEIEQVYQDSSASGKQAHEFLERRRKAETKAAGELKQRTAQDAARVGPGVDDALESVLYHAIKGGADARAATGDQRAGLIPLLRSREVGEDVVSDVAQTILDKAKNAAQNLINENKLPKIDKEEAAALLKGQRQAAAADRKATAEQTHQIGKLAPGLLPELEAAINTNRLAQATGDPGMRRENDVLNELQGKVAGLLQQSGQDPRLAHGIVVKALQDSNAKYTSALARTGNMTDALLQIVTGSISQLAGQEERIARQERQIQELHTKINFLGNNARRHQVVMPPGGITFSGSG